VKTGDNILWRTSLPGLGHSSPVVWGSRVFVTTAISANPKATFKPGLYGDGDSSDDRSPHRFVTYAIDKRSGTILWERVAYEGPPVDKRHIKSTYASATPATDGRVVVSWFGSQGVFAYDMNGRLRWKVDLGISRWALTTSRRWNGARQLADHLEWSCHPSSATHTPIHFFWLLMKTPADRVEDRTRRAAGLGNTNGRDDVTGTGTRDKRLELHPRIRSAKW
jgi:hypothetical protein